MEYQFAHKTVLAQESVNLLALAQGSIAIDCTAGGGGHLALLLEKCGKTGKVIALDQDEVAINHLRTRFAKEIDENRLQLHKSSFVHLQRICGDLDIIDKIDAVFADLGVSSPQLDEAQRGFSFAKDGLLDMRMDQNAQIPNAKDLIASLNTDELKRIFFLYGEEPMAARIAKAITKARALKEITTTSELANIISKAIPYRQKSKKHPATKCFQALRIAVNNELDSLSELLKQGFHCLRKNGRMGIISFHSLEDKIVKDFCKNKEKGSYDPILEKLPLRENEITALKGSESIIIKPFPLTPKEDEIKENPRARSAKLRVLQKV